MVLGTLLCSAAWGVVVMQTDPFVATPTTFIFFYVSAFLGFFGASSLVAFLMYYFFSSEPLPIFRYVQKSFRAAFFSSCILVSLLVLQGSGMIQTWNFIVLILALLLFIIFRLSIKPAPRGNHTNGSAPL